MIGSGIDRVVVDSSVVIKWYVAEEDSDKATNLILDYRAGNLTLLSPDFIYIEIANIVWKKHTFKGLSAADAQAIVDDVGTLGLIETHMFDLLEEAYRLAVAHKCSVYDGFYVAVSVREQCPLVTADEKLIKALSAFSPSPILLADWV